MGLTSEARARGHAVNAAQAQARAAELEPTIRELQASGVTSAYGIARALNEREMPTTRGKARWHPWQVKRVLDRL